MIVSDGLAGPGSLLPQPGGAPGQQHQERAGRLRITTRGAKLFATPGSLKPLHLEVELCSLGRRGERLRGNWPGRHGQGGRQPGSAPAGRRDVALAWGKVGSGAGAVGHPVGTDPGHRDRQGAGQRRQRAVGIVQRKGPADAQIGYGRIKPQDAPAVRTQCRHHVGQRI